MDLKELQSVEGNHKFSLPAPYKTNIEGNQYKVNIAVIYADSRNGGGGGGGGNLMKILSIKAKFKC